MTHHKGWTLVELVVVMAVIGVLSLVAPPLVWRGTQTMVVLPRELAVNHVTAEVTHQLIEGGFSALPGRTTPIRGLRFAIRTVPTGGSAVQPPLWLAETNRIGFLTADGDYVLIRLDAETIKRSLPPTSTTCASVPALTEERIPDQTPGAVRILTTTALFRYYNQAGAEIGVPGCPPNSTIRRVDIAFVAQTGNGMFDNGNAREQVTSSVAIRMP